MTVRPCTCGPREFAPTEPGALLCFRCGGQREPTPAAAVRWSCLNLATASEIAGGICLSCGCLLDRRTA